MTTHRLVWHQCEADDCLESTAELDKTTVAESWEAAKAMGWRNVNGRHLCGKHVDP